MITDIIKAREDTINHVKKQYNQALSRMKAADKYMVNTDIPKEERELHVLTYKVEIVETMDSYLRILKNWNVNVSGEETVNGFNV